MAACLGLSGCASTSFEPQGHGLPLELCDAQSHDLALTVAWTTRWRPDQKEPAARNAAALRGIERHVQSLSCFRESAIRVFKSPTDPSALSVGEVLSRLRGDRSERVVVLVIRELGPHLRLGLPWLIEGGTEVQFDVRVIDRRQATELASGRVRWQQRGPFHLRGTGDLDQDLSSALTQALGTFDRPRGSLAPVHQASPPSSDLPHRHPPPDTSPANISGTNTKGARWGPS